MHLVVLLGNPLVSVVPKITARRGVVPFTLEKRGRMEAVLMVFQSPLCVPVKHGALWFP